MHSDYLMVNTDMSLWTPLFTEEARRQACTQYRSRCCNCGSSEHRFRLCPAPFQNVFSLLNPEFATHDPDRFTFETWKRRMRNWRRTGPQQRYQGNGRRHTPDNGPLHPRNTGHSSAPQGNSSGTALALVLQPSSPINNARDERPCPCGPGHALWSYLLNE